MKDQDRPLVFVLWFLTIALAANFFIEASPFEPSFWVDEACKAGVFYCLAYTWQTLIAGSIASVGAFLTIRKMQAQIRLSNWQHAAEEMRQLAEEKTKTAKTTLHLIEHFSSIYPAFAPQNLQERSFTGNHFANKNVGYHDTFEWLQSLPEKLDRDFDPATGGKSVWKARETFKAAIATAARYLPNTEAKVIEELDDALERYRKKGELWTSEEYIIEAQKIILKNKIENNLDSIKFDLQKNCINYNNSIENRIAELKRRYGYN